MACPTLTEFRLRFPEFAVTVDDAQVERILVDTCAALESAAFGGAFWEEAALLHAAHTVILEQMDAGIAVASVTHDIKPQNNFETIYCTTSYGQRFVVLSRQVTNVANVINSDWRTFL